MLVMLQSVVSNPDMQSASTRYESLPAVDDPLSSTEPNTGPSSSAEQAASTSTPAVNDSSTEKNAIPGTNYESQPAVNDPSSTVKCLSVVFLDQDFLVIETSL